MQHNNFCLYKEYRKAIRKTAFLFKAVLIESILWYIQLQPSYHKYLNKI